MPGNLPAENYHPENFITDQSTDFAMAESALIVIDVLNAFCNQL